MNSLIKTFTLRMPTGLWRALKSCSQKSGYTLNSFILQILWEWVKKNGVKLPENQTA